VIYEIAFGTWTQSVLYTFTGGSDGANPAAGLLKDKADNLYGTTTFGGEKNYGSSSSFRRPSRRAIPGPRPHFTTFRVATTAKRQTPP